MIILLDVAKAFTKSNTLHHKKTLNLQENVLNPDRGHI